MGIIILFCGGLYFTLANLLLTRYLSSRFHKLLSTADVYLIVEKCVSSLQAIMATAVGFIIAYQCQDNIMTDTYWLTNTYAWFGLPYFAYDIWAMYNTHFYSKEPEMTALSRGARLQHFVKHNVAMLIHHVFLPCIFFPIILFARSDKGDYFVGVFYSLEAAIPFIAVRFILAQLELKHSLLYIVSGLLMIVVFFLVRVGIFPFLYWRYSQYAGVPFLHVPTSIPIKCNIGCLLVLVIQLYFLYLMVRGAIRVFVKIYKKRKSKIG